MKEDPVMYPVNIEDLAKDPKYFGRMNDPTGGASIKGPCGDEMEFYLDINDGVIEDIKFYTGGCVTTIACGSMTAQLALGKSIEDALGISPKTVISKLSGLPEEQRHCSVLAVSTLYKAIVDYLFRK